MRIREYGSEFDWDDQNRYVIMNELPPLIKNSILVRSGRDAIWAIAAKHREEYKRVLLPALCCTAMVLPFAKNGYETVFYRLAEDFSADMQDIRNKLGSKALLVYMNYFGMPSLIKEQMNWIRGLGDVLFIQDRTHDLLAGCEMDPMPDYTVASIRKWAALADGGILHASKDGFGLCKTIHYGESGFSSIRASALKHKHMYLQTGSPEMKSRFREEFRKANEILEESNECCAISESTRNLLPHIDFTAIFLQRQLNIQALRRLLIGIPGVLDAVPCPERSALYYPILVSHRDKVQPMMAGLGVYCPVIWPVPELAKGVCKTAHKMSEHMLALPCDQRYTPDDMEFVCYALKQSMEELAG